MKTIAQKIGDSLLKHLVFLDRLNRRESRELRKTIVVVKKQIQNALKKNADIFDGVEGLSDFKRRRLENVLDEINTLVATLTLRIDKQLENSLVAVAESENRLLTRILDTQVPSELGLSFSRVPEERLARLPFNSIANENYKTRLSKKSRKVLDQSRISLANSLILGESFASATKRLTTVIDQQYTNQASNIVRTELHRTATDVMTESYKENKNFIERLEWVTALDEDVCPICEELRHDSLDNPSRWTVELAPEPVYDSHPRCRCVRVI
jgi:SPP1 gp7 family putative phage head morphogenesis protein